LVRASRIRRATNAGSRRRSRGEKCSMMIPAAAIRSWRRLVRSQSSGDRCQARESASAATPASCHQASGLPRKTSPRYNEGLNSGIGSRFTRITSRRSPSAVDLMPSATSASTERNIAEPFTGPQASSSPSSRTVHRPNWTASATTARTSRSVLSSRAVSATARGAGAIRSGPLDEIRAGILVVRCSRAKPVLSRCRRAGTGHRSDPRTGRS